MAASTPTMTVLHLDSGHVLAAIASGSRTVTVADLTGGTYLAVRLPGSTSQVNVPAELLTAVAVALDEDALDRPLDFAVGTSPPPLRYAGPPIDVSSGISAPANTAATSLWQVGDTVEVAKDTLTAAGKPDGSAPPGATHRLVAVVGEPLAYED